MSELEPTPEKSAAVAVPHPTPPAPVYDPPLQPSRDLGLLLVVLGIVGTMLPAWILFSQNSTDDMVAGYWCTAFCVLAGLATTAQRTALEGPVPPGLVALSGVGLVLVGLLNDYSETVTWTMTVGGIVIALGGLAQGAPKRT